ncbi:MAG: LptF/LptG family permease, partial [Alphaproteobacteria bacterium]
KDDNNILKGLLINDQRADDYAITLTAQTANIILRDNEIYLRLNNGSLHRYNYATMKSEILKFDNYIFNLNEKNQELFQYKWKPNERFLSELIFYEDSLSGKEIKELKSELHKRINDPLISLVFSIIISTVLFKSKIIRKGNNFNNLTALMICVIYILLLIFSYRLNDKNEELFYLPYLINLFFYLTPLVFLLINPSKSKL